MDISKVTKIDIGSGGNPKVGFISLDLNVSADIKADILHMPFKDGQIEEINMSHVLEHFATSEIQLVLTECRRVLKNGGVLSIEVPDFEWNVRDWISAREEDRWGHRIQRIYGLQSNPGDFHKTGFTSWRLSNVLDKAGFLNISVSKLEVEPHGGVLRVTVVK